MKGNIGEIANRRLDLGFFGEIGIRDDFFDLDDRPGTNCFRYNPSRKIRVPQLILVCMQPEQAILDN